MKKQGPGTRDQGLGIYGPGLILLGAFIAVVPQLIRGNSCGHDFNVHLGWIA